MAKQQQKRRRKRYRPGSAYAGDVKPTGVLGFLGSAGMIRVVFIGMALALAVGGGVAIFAGDTFFQTTTQDSFVLPDDDFTPQPTPSSGETIEVRQYAAPPPMTIDPSSRYVATIRTALGDIEVELLADQAPATVNNFVFLAQDGFYDGLAFHQVTQGFAAQAGDPTCVADASASACRGDRGPGYDLSESASGDLGRGTLGMANASQFFIALSDSEEFDRFTPLGRVLSGLDVAERLVRGTEIQSIDIQVQ